jgi:hypothetical protein
MSENHKIWFITGISRGLGLELAKAVLAKAALPFLRAQRRGHIVNISSIAGPAPLSGSGIYAATKFALEGLSESLAQEVGPLGIRVTLVEPGAFRTDFLSAHSIRNAAGSIAAYAKTSGKIVGHLHRIAGKQQGDPVLAARAIIEAVEAKEPPLHLVLGSDALRRARAKFQHLSEEVDRWEQVALSTDFTDQPEFLRVKTIRNAEDSHQRHGAQDFVKQERTNPNAAGSTASPLASFSLQRGKSPSDDVLVEVRY